VGKLRFTKLACMVFMALVVMAGAAVAQTFTTLTSFDISNGRQPQAPLVQGIDGNLYGTTSLGGANDGGVVFKVSSAGTQSVIYNFCFGDNCSNGSEPHAGLVVGANGNLYGTTAVGGAYCLGDLALGCGTVFEITPAGKLTTLYQFCANSTNCADGAYPEAPLVLAANGNFYGTTYQGGTNDLGTVFEITPNGKLSTLYSFCSQKNCPDGSYPVTGLVQGANGNLYGTTYDGGAINCSFFNNTYGCGTIFEITPAGKLTTLYNFGRANGLLQQPLVQASNGKLYGTSLDGGTGGCKVGCGTVFEITTAGALSTLYNFCTQGLNYCPDGAYPMATMVQATDGNLYGITTTGGTGAGGGTIFAITPQGMLTTLYSTQNLDGYQSEGGMVQATDGNFYGSMSGGGVNNQGTIFSFSMGLGPFVEAVSSAGHPGAKVLILGNNLTGTTSVSFAGTQASFTVVSNTKITATVPDGATSGKIAVAAPTGTLSSNKAFRIIP
jgi:uncharacterized repeat protein (TIGR03803 family)